MPTQETIWRRLKNRIVGENDSTHCQLCMLDLVRLFLNKSGWGAVSIEPCSEHEQVCFT